MRNQPTMRDVCAIGRDGRRVAWTLPAQWKKQSAAPLFAGVATDRYTACASEIIDVETRCSCRTAVPTRCRRPGCAARSRRRASAIGTKQAATALRTVCAERRMRRSDRAIPVGRNTQSKGTSNR